MHKANVKNFKKLISITLIFTLLLVTSLGVYAQGKTIANGGATLEVSNFAKVLTDLAGQKIDLKEDLISSSRSYSVTLDDAFQVEVPSKITLKSDISGSFNVYKVIGAVFVQFVDGKEVVTDKKSYIYQPEYHRLPLSSGKFDKAAGKCYSGATIEIKEPGEYFIDFTLRDKNGKKTVYALIDAKEASDIKNNAQPNVSKVLVNGKDTIFDSYTIDGNNYFKLRDLAKALSGTQKQFDVGWDNEKKAINLIYGKAYTPVGGELSKGDGEAKAAVENTSAVYKDGKNIKLKAYTINSNNYFKLRDIAQVFNIGITWDGTTKAIGIDTSIGYEGDAPIAPKLEIASVNAINGNQIKIIFKNPITKGQAGEYYSAVAQSVIEGAPWEIGKTLTLKEGQKDITIKLSEEYDIKFPKAGEYDFYLEGVTNETITFIVPDNML